VTTTPELAPIKEAVQAALTAITDTYGSEKVRAVPDGQGGAWTEIAGIELGDRYVQGSTFVICLLPFNLPGADIYPLFVRNDLTRRDGNGLGEGFGAANVSWPGDPEPRAALQVSRRTRRSEFTLQTPLQKIEKVLDWIRTR
jgi:hypothetical protein